MVTHNFITQSKNFGMAIAWPPIPKPTVPEFFMVPTLRNFKNDIYYLLRNLLVYPKHIDEYKEIVLRMDLVLREYFKMIQYSEHVPIQIKYQLGGKIKHFILITNLGLSDFEATIDILIPSGYEEKGNYGFGLDRLTFVLNSYHGISIINY